MSSYLSINRLPDTGMRPLWTDAKQKKESGTGEKALEELYQKHSSEVSSLLS